MSNYRMERLKGVVVFYDEHNEPILTAMRSAIDYLVMVHPRYGWADEILRYASIDGVEFLVGLILKGGKP